jgi:hypothetical protein
MKLKNPSPDSDFWTWVDDRPYKYKLLPVLRLLSGSKREKQRENNATGRVYRPACSVLYWQEHCVPKCRSGQFVDREI